MRNIFGSIPCTIVQPDTTIDSADVKLKPRGVVFINDAAFIINKRTRLYANKPRFPDDVMVLDHFLPVYDPNILIIEQENSDLSLW